MKHLKRIFLGVLRFIYAPSPRLFRGLGSASIVLFLYSCRTAEEPPAKIINDMEGEKRTGLYKNKTQEDLVSEGWTIIKEIFPKKDIPKIPINKSGSVVDVVSNTEKEIPFTSVHLKELGYDIGTFQSKDLLKNIFGVLVIFNPDFYFVNDRSKQYENFMKSVNTCSICGGNVDKFIDKESRDKTNLFISVGTPQTIIEEKKIAIPDEIYGEQVVENRGETPVKQTVKIGVKEGFSTRWDSKISTLFKLEVKASIGIPMVLGGELSTQIGIGSEFGFGENKSTEKTIEQSTEIVVPPHSRVKVVALTKKNATSVTYFVPVKLKGNIIASPQDVNEPQILDINDKSFKDFLSKNNGGEKGLLKVMEVVSSSLIVSPSEPL